MGPSRDTFPSDRPNADKLPPCPLNELSRPAKPPLPLHKCVGPYLAKPPGSVASSSQDSASCESEATACTKALLWSNGANRLPMTCLRGRPQGSSRMEVCPSRANNLAEFLRLAFCLRMGAGHAQTKTFGRLFHTQAILASFLALPPADLDLLAGCARLGIRPRADPSKRCPAPLSPSFRAYSSARRRSSR